MDCVETKALKTSFWLEKDFVVEEDDKEEEGYSYVSSQEHDLKTCFDGPSIKNEFGSVRKQTSKENPRTERGIGFQFRSLEQSVTTIFGLYSRSYDWIEKAVVFRPQLKNWQSVVHDGLLEANVIPYNGFNIHHVVGTKIGGSTFDGLGRRHSAADLLNHARPSNIMVVLHASVERILFNSLSSDSEEIDAQRVLGYALFKDGKDTRLSYPLEKFHLDVAGRSFHNGRFIQRMREKVASLPK
ncbi:hypothetical protein IFM89_006265 [Coptis chinensis]|uniref:Uncharacterized protein n=1 Tax=Coptis chinensis TaxID=261450 RepID=A0A835GWS7_9MAGN|nr:hypothetical protein IFM89_006265 [Coptis chinensis]